MSSIQDPSIPPTPAPEMRGTAGRGMAFMLANTIASKVMALVAIAVVGSVLTTHEWGLYGLAISIMMFVQTLRDGGVRELLVQRGREWDTLVGPAFWLCMALNTGVALLVGLAGEGIAHLYAAAGKISSPGELSRLLWVAAAANALSAPSSILTAKLAVDLRFRAIAWLQVTGSAIRYTTQIVLALEGFGAMSLMVPAVLITVFDAVVAWWLTRQSPWMHPPQFRRWRDIIGTSWWLVLAQTCNGVANSGYLLLAGSFLTVTQVGLYTFALNLLMQVETSVTYSLSQVMFPVLSRLSGDPGRQAAAALRVARATALLTALLAIGLAITFTPLERMVWGGKWADAALPLALLAAFYPVRAVFAGVTAPLLQAGGHFRACAGAWGSLALGALLVAAVTRALWPTPVALAAGIGAVTSMLALFVSLGALRRRGVRARAVGMVVLAPPLAAIAAAAAVWWLDAAAVAPWMAGALPGALYLGSHAVAASDLARFLIAGAAFTLLFVAVIRLLAPAHLADLLSIVPARLHALASGVLRLPTY